MTIRRGLLLTAAWCTLCSWCDAQSTTTLNVDVFSPIGPITTADQVQIRAHTTIDVFPTGGYRVLTHDWSIQGTAIEWNIWSYPPPPDSFNTQALEPMGKIQNVGQLAAGDYTVNAHWQHQGWTPPEWPSSGDGTLNFTVGALGQSQVYDGDYDVDGDVDGADLLVWQGSLGMASEPPQTGPPGDGDHDGVVEGDDLDVWQSDFVAASGAANSATPEPATLTIAVTLTLAAMCGRRFTQFRSVR